MCPPKMKVLRREEGEGLFTNALSAMGGRERNEYRKLPLQELATSLLPEGFFVWPVLSNLAVSSACRGQGLGKLICEQCAQQAADWGFGGLMLVVEENNTPARSLYQSLGYGDVWRDENSY